MTSTKDFASKAVVAFAAIALAFSVFAAPAKAQSTEDLQKMINDLLAQVAALQASTGQGATSVASGVCPYTWTRNLNVGATGADVMKLQQFLNADADTRVSASGAGSVGAETEYYGPATAAAVSKMQVKYRSEILSPAGLVNPTGFFGPSSRAKANSVCVASPVVVPPVVNPGDDSSDNDNDNNSGNNNGGSKDLQGSANLETAEIDNPSDTTVDEGDEDVEIGVATIGFENGDAELDRLDVQITSSGVYGTLGTDPWDVFDKLSLWVDGDMIAEFDSSDENDWLDDNSGTFRFSNLNMVFEEDQEYDITIAADINDGLETYETVQWDVYLEALRFFDADNVSSDETSFDELGGDSSSNFGIQNSGTDEQLTFRIGANNPDGGTIVVDDTSNTDDVTIFEYEIEAEEGDIDLDTLIVRLDTVGNAIAGKDVEDVISNIELVIDGQTFSDEGFGTLAQLGAKSYMYKGTDGTSGTAVVPNSNGQVIPNLGATDGVAAWYAFDIDNDITIPENGKVTVQVVVDLRQQTGNYTNGTQLQARVTTPERNATDSEGREQLRDDNGSFSGSAIDEPHTLVAQGLAFDIVSINEKLTTGAGTTNPKDTAEFELVVDVTAVEESFYIDDIGTAFNVTTFENGTSSLATTTTISKTVSASGANKQNSRFRIDNGDSERFTFKVTVFPNGANPGGVYRVQFDDVNFYDAPTGGTLDNQMFVPVSDYRSDDVTIVN